MVGLAHTLARSPPLHPSSSSSAARSMEFLPTLNEESEYDLMTDTAASSFKDEKKIVITSKLCLHCKKSFPSNEISKHVNQCLSSNPNLHSKKAYNITWFYQKGEDGEPKQAAKTAAASQDHQFFLMWEN